VVLCQSGHRGALAMMYLRMIGYTNVRNLGGGMNAWIAAELPVVK
jgi:rhodanese-related sulfurtransferase